MDDGQEFEPGDRVSWFGGEGTVLDTKNDDIQVVKDNNEVIELSPDLPMLNMVHEFESGERVSLSDGEGEIIKVEERDGNPDLLYVNMDSGELKKIHADKKELEPVSGIRQRLANGEFDRPEQFNLREWSVQLDLAHRFDRFVSLEGARIDVVPHQVEAAHEVLTSHDQRHLLADEVGLGKTIEAGIIIEELIARGQDDGVLIVTPASLTLQWQEEMAEKFDRDYVIYDRGYIDKLKHIDGSVWDHDDFIITSIDFAKRDDVIEELRASSWDIAVFDEAHHLTARRGSEGSRETTDRFDASEVVAERTDSLLFLTGTPHKGKHDQFYFMVSLLEPYRFEDEHDISPSQLDDLMIRRLKSNPHLVHPDGSPMFPEKNIETLPVQFTEQERELYEDVTDYIRNQYRLGEEQEATATGFSMVIYQKRLVSSIRAIRKSLEKRKRDLETGGQGLSTLSRKLLDRYRSRPETLTDEQRQQVEREIQESSVSQSPEDVTTEIETLEGLIQRTREIDIDSKAAKLRDFVDGILAEDPDEKVLIFTEYTDTLRYLKNDVFDDHDVATIHGEQGQPTRREQRKKFRDEVNIMVANDAAREGINLQFAHIMVNYDLPWNPIRIDQRMGRLHRYGQDQTVNVYNLFVKDTRESRILEHLVTRIDRIEDDLGMSSDVLGIVLDDDDVDLRERIMQAVAQDEQSEEVVADLDEIIEERKEAMKTIQDDFLISDQFGESELEEVQEVIEESKEEHIGQSEIERLVRLFTKEFGGSMKVKSDRSEGTVYTVEVPDVLEIRADLQSSYSPVTFSQELAKEDDYIDFLSLNHQLIQAMIDYSLDKDCVDGSTTVMRATDDADIPGLLLNYRIGYQSADGSDEAEEFIQYYATGPEQITEEPPSTEVVDAESIESVIDEAGVLEDAEAIVEAAGEQAQRRLDDLIKSAEKEKKEIVAEKREEAKAYFEDAIQTWENRLHEYQQRESQGDDMEMPIRRARSELQELRDERDRTFDELKQEAAITQKSNTPELINGALILPST